MKLMSNSIAATNMPKQLSDALASIERRIGYEEAELFQNEHPCGKLRNNSL